MGPRFIDGPTQAMIASDPCRSDRSAAYLARRELERKEQSEA